MSEIHVSVTDQRLKVVTAPTLASGGINEVKVVFNFCGKWDGFVKTAIFYRDTDKIYYAVLNENDICILPWEVYAEDGTFFISVFGEKDDTRRTSTIVRYKVGKGIVAEELMPSEPSPEVYDQIIKLFQDTKETVSGAEDAARRANDIAADLEQKLADGYFNGEPGETVDDGRVGNAPWSSKNTVDKLCPSFAESGSVVTCAPVEGYPLGVVSKIEPVQEGEGDPSPSITGDSAIIDVLHPDESTAKVFSDGIKSFTTYKFTINASVAPYDIRVFTFGSDDTLAYVNNEFSVVFTTELDRNVVITIQWEGSKPADAEGSSPYILQTYTPGNIRPITGHTAVKLWRGGKNLFKMTAESQTVNGVAFTVNDDGTVTANGTATSNVFFKCGYVYYPRLGMEYQISGSPHGNKSNTWNVYAGAGYDYSNDGRYTPTVKQNMVHIYIAPGQTMTNAVFKPMLRVAGTSAVYEPYQGEEFTADLGQTVYGGSYDWQTGVLTVDKAFLTLSGATEFNFNNVTGNISQFYYSLAERAVVGEACVCSHYVGSAEDAYNGKIDKTITARGSNLWICDSSFSSAAEFSAYLAEQYANGTPVQVAYPMATPVTVHLTPQEILALSGTNTLYSDTGDTDASGKADPNAVIEKLTNAIIALGGNV